MFAMMVSIMIKINNNAIFVFLNMEVLAIYVLIQDVLHAVADFLIRELCVYLALKLWILIVKLAM
jgi:hypothetical protein